jgi:hypothetical protein
MQKSYEDSDRITYHKRPLVLLWAAPAMAAISVGGYFLQVSTFACTVVLVLSLGFAATGLSGELLQLDLVRRTMHYEFRVAGYPAVTTDDSFDRISSILVLDNSVSHTGPGEITVQPAWNVVLKYTGARPAGYEIGTYVKVEDARREAQLLADKLRIEIEIDPGRMRGSI